MEFTLPRLPTSITGVFLEIQGDLNAGVERCPRFDRPMDMLFTGTMWDSTTGGTWRATDRTYFTEPFLVRKKFGSGDGATWASLMRGAGFIWLQGRCNPDAGCAMIAEASASVDRVTLIIQGEFQVPIESKTWGAIKAVFR